MLFAFTFFSVIGWILEVAYRSTRDRRFINPGLLKGPYLILYGTAALVLIGSISVIHEYGIFLKIFCYFIITTGLELISGFNAQRFFNVRLWDYSDQRFQFKGHICLKFSIYWIILAFAFEYLVLPPYLFQFKGHICLKFSIYWIILAFAFEYLVLPPYLRITSELSPEVIGVFAATGILIMLMDLVLLIKRKPYPFAGILKRKTT
jgi:uncharacterized membrane protein